jgi:hypothetical protein
MKKNVKASKLQIKNKSTWCYLMVGNIEVKQMGRFQKEKVNRLVQTEIIIRDIFQEERSRVTVYINFPTTWFTKGSLDKI